MERNVVLKCLLTCVRVIVCQSDEDTRSPEHNKCSPEHNKFETTSQIRYVLICFYFAGSRSALGAGSMTIDTDPRIRIRINIIRIPDTG